MGSRRPQGSASGSSGTDGSVTGRVSTLLSVPDPLDDWLLGPLEELEAGWDAGLDWEQDAVSWVGDRVDWVDWDGPASRGRSSDIDTDRKTTADCGGEPEAQIRLRIQ